MEAVRQLMEATIIPIITYGSVAWEQKKNGTTRNDIQQSPKNHPPPTTADANKHPTSRNRKYPYGINNQEEKTNARQQNNNKQNRGLVQITTDGDSIWKENIKKIQQEYVTEEELTRGKEELKKKIDRENRHKFETNIKQEAEPK